MHKHFRMIAIAQQLRHHGVTGPDDKHTRIPGIWQKLRTLYNLEAIDARVNGPGLRTPGFLHNVAKALMTA